MMIGIVCKWDPLPLKLTFVMIVVCGTETSATIR